jgi:hypothetical protein
MSAPSKAKHRSPELDDRIPANLETERALLGCILAEQVGFNTVRSSLGPDDLFLGEAQGVRQKVGGRLVSVNLLNNRLV